MHEYSIIQALLARVDREARARKATSVHRLHLRIGELSGVEIELLTRAFETFRERSLCAGAEMDVQPVAAEWTCPGCGESIARGAILRCRACGLPARLVRGDEIVLDRIEMEVPDHV
jgi:hydrogenase nickel incorporation protein HypA/HybF